MVLVQAEDDEKEMVKGEGGDAEEGGGEEDEARCLQHGVHASAQAWSRRGTCGRSTARVCSRG